MTDFIKLNEVVTIIKQQYDNLIINTATEKMMRVSRNIGIHINENKLKEWLQICAKIELMSDEHKAMLSRELEYQRLNEEIESLKRKVSDLQFELEEKEDD